MTYRSTDWMRGAAVVDVPTDELPGQGTTAKALVVSTAAGSAGSSATTPAYVTAAQGTPTTSTITFVAGEAQTIIPANANIRGARALNWITTAPVYHTPGTTGTPTSGAPSDYIPAAAAGPIPAQFEWPYAPTNGVRAVCASAGTLTIETW